MIDDMEKNAKTQIARIASATIYLCETMDAEHAAINARNEYVTATVNSLIGQPNVVTGKPHSQASATAWAEEQDEYKRLAAKRIDAEKERLCASAAAEAARLHAKLAVAVLEHAVPSGDLH